MRRSLIPCTLALVFVAAGCNTSGLTNQPRATFSQLACLDVNGDDRISAADASDASRLPDFNADRSRDADDSAFLQGVDIALLPERDRAPCEGKAKKTPEYLVAHGYITPSDVSCDGGARPVLLLGIGGGNANLRDAADAAGVRKAVDALQQEYDDRGVETIGVIAGPGIGGGEHVQGAMEQWLANAVNVYFERYPCLRAVFVGHSHGAVTVDVVSAALEDQYADRIIAAVKLDRVDVLYDGDTASRPATVYVLNVYETTDTRLHGGADDGANVENWDASAEEAPERGQDGGDDQPVNHTTIDNSGAIHDRIVAEVMERS